MPHRTVPFSPVALQCDIVAYLRSILSVLKPHLGLLAADAAHWNQQLVDDGPSLSISEDAAAPWGLPTHPFPTRSPLPFSSTPEDSKQHADNGLGTNQAGESWGAEGLDMSQTASEALKGMIRLGWLLLCRARLSTAWQGNLKHTQQALMTGSFEVSSWSAEVSITEIGFQGKPFRGFDFSLCCYSLLTAQFMSRLSPTVRWCCTAAFCIVTLLAATTCETCCLHGKPKTPGCL